MVYKIKQNYNKKKLKISGNVRNVLYLFLSNGAL